MKKFLAALAVLSATTASAMDAKFGDLNYFLKQGQMNLTFDANMRTEDTRTNGAKDEAEGYVFNPSLGYAVSDDLNVVLKLQHLYQMKSNTTETSGLQNPQFAANYRLMKQADSGFNVDLGAVLSLKVTDREVSSSSEDGNMIDPFSSNYAEPRNTLDLNARLGNKWNEANEFYLLAGAAFHMAGDYEQNGGNDVDLESSMDFKLGGYYQYRPVNEFMMTLGLVGTRFGEMDGEAGGNDFTSQDHLDFEFIFKAKYLVNETTIVYFNFTDERRADYDIENEGAADTKLDKRMAASYGLGIDLLF